MNSFKKNIFKTDSEDSITPPPTFRAWNFSNPGRSSSGLACGNTTFTNTWYTTYQTGALPSMGSTLHSSSSLSSPISGGNLWYNLEDAFIDGTPTVYQIGNSGTLDNFFNCP
jgi:hypothetical protein